MKIGFLNLLTLLFIGLKLTENINWSWWLVLAPTWVGFVIGLFIGGLHYYFLTTDPIYRLRNQSNEYKRTGRPPL